MILFLTSIDGLAAKPINKADTLALASTVAPNCHADGKVKITLAAQTTIISPYAILVIITNCVCSFFALGFFVEFMKSLSFEMVMDKALTKLIAVQAERSKRSMIKMCRIGSRIDSSTLVTRARHIRIAIVGNIKNVGLALSKKIGIA